MTNELDTDPKPIPEPMTITCDCGKQTPIVGHEGQPVFCSNCGNFLAKVPHTQMLGEPS
jgi:ribosomal protein S27E